MNDDDDVFLLLPFLPSPPPYGTIGFHEVACGAPGYLYGSGATGFWVQAFILSKLFELIDTVFIVLRKRPLNFLHWYVHDPASV